MTRKTRSAAPAVCAGVLAFAASAFAGLRTLPTPPQSEFADAESSAVVALPVNEGRHIRLTVVFDPSPTNAVMVADQWGLSERESARIRRIPANDGTTIRVNSPDWRRFAFCLDHQLDRPRQVTLTSDALSPVPGPLGVKLDRVSSPWTDPPGRRSSCSRSAP